MRKDSRSGMADPLFITFEVKKFRSSEHKTIKVLISIENSTLIYWGGLRNNQTIQPLSKATTRVAATNLHK